LGQAALQALEQNRLRKDRRVISEVLQETEARYRSLFENTIEGIFQTTPEGRVLTANPALARILGYSSHEELLQSSLDIQAQFYPDSVSRAEMLTRLARESEISGYESQAKRRDGTLVWVAVNARAARDSQGKILHVDGTLEDISRRKQLESQLLRAQRLESVGRLAGGIAHDLNNLLSPILMAPSLLRDRLPDASSHKLLDAIEASARRGAEIIKQLLTFSRGVEGPLRPIQLPDLVSDMIKIIRETFPKNITIQYEFAPVLPMVNGDTTQMEQVAMNLCVNARDAMPDGGTLTLSLEQVEVDEDLASLNPDAKAGSYVLLRVTDTGMGINPEILDVIFDPFFTTKEMGKGTGLGLSTVIGIVKGHRGFIHVSSVLGRGTQFQIYLPACADSVEAGSDKVEEITPHGNGELILVVDDDPVTRHLVRKILERKGYRIIEATDGAQAVVQFLRSRSDIRLVITDAIMPEMDGLEFLEQMRGQGSKVPVILITSLRDSINLDAYRGQGANSVIDKPFRGAYLVETVQRLLEAHGE